MMFSEKLNRPSTSGGRLFMILLVGLAVAVALCMAFASDAEAKKNKKKRKPHYKPLTTTLPAPNCIRPPVYNGESIAQAWGDNTFRQLGNDTMIESTTPVQVNNLSGVKAIDGGSFHSLALKEDCTVWAWGYNMYGQLGDGTNTERYTPSKVSNLSGVKAIAAGEQHNLALKTDGTVWAWGYNDNGQLGDGTSGTDRTMPVQVSNLSGVKAIAAGHSHSLALKEDGTVWAWGDNSLGLLGNGTKDTSTTPVKVSNLSGIKTIDAGDSHSLALKEDGAVWAWGDNSLGQLGAGTSGTNRTTPVKVRGEPPTNTLPNSALISPPVVGNYLSGVKAIAAGWHHSLAVKEDGTVVAWGYNFRGQLGNGTSGPGLHSNTPVKVSNLQGVKTVAAGEEHSLALKEDGTVRAWGYNVSGQLGNGTEDATSTTPVKVSNLNGVEAIAAGEDHSLAKVEKPPLAQQ